MNKQDESETVQIQESELAKMKGFKYLESTVYSNGECTDRKVK